MEFKTVGFRNSFCRCQGRQLCSREKTFASLRSLLDSTIGLLVIGPTTLYSESWHNLVLDHRTQTRNRIMRARL